MSRVGAGHQECARYDLDLGGGVRERLTVGPDGEGCRTLGGERDVAAAKGLHCRVVDVATAEGPREDPQQGEATHLPHHHDIGEPVVGSGVGFGVAAATVGMGVGSAVGMPVGTFVGGGVGAGVAYALHTPYSWQWRYVEFTG